MDDKSKSGLEIYVTVGTIQVKLDANGKATEILVAPTQDFTVKFGKDSYIVLLPLDKDRKKIADVQDAKFVKLENSSFTVRGHSESILTQLALKRAAVEIQCEFKTANTASVVSLKIPANA